MPDQLRDFQPLAGSTFDVEGQGPLCLEQVTPHEDAVTEGFSLGFSGSRDVRLPQGIHTLTHPALGTFELFLVPVQDPRPDRFAYEAIFNRLKPRPSGGA